MEKAIIIIKPMMALPGLLDRFHKHAQAKKDSIRLGLADQEENL